MERPPARSGKSVTSGTSSPPQSPAEADPGFSPSANSFPSQSSPSTAALSPASSSVMAFPQLDKSSFSTASSSSRRDSTLSGCNPAFQHTRLRRTTMPASLVHTRYSMMVGSSGSSTLRVKDKSDHRISVASFSSIESVTEEDETGDGSNGATGVAPKASGLSRRPRAVSRRTASPPASRPSSLARPPIPSRLPTSSYHGGYQSFSVALPPGKDGARSASPLGALSREGDAELKEMSEEERAKRVERRWRIAEELRDTEKAYVQVLEEVDALYYQPLIAALPTSDPLSRRSSTRYSTARPFPSSHSSSPAVSPRASVYTATSPITSPRSRTSTCVSTNSVGSTPSTAPSTPPTPHAHSGGPILDRREINEIFSNFTDVLNLSHVMLLAVDQAVPARPSQPLPVVLSPKSSASPLMESPAELAKPASAPEVATAAGGSSLDSQPGGLSTSAETSASSTGPVTPGNGSPPSVERTRIRTTSARSTRHHSQPTPPPVRLGKALLPILPFLKQYSLFVANFSASLARLSSLEAAIDSAVSPVGSNGAPGSSSADRARWQAFAEEAQRRRIEAVGAGSGKIGLGGLLLNIVQRVPRYRLLLKDLIRFTEEDHPDLRDLETAFSLVAGVASHLETQIQSHTNDLRILDLQRAITNLDAPLLSPGRRLLKTGVLHKLNRSGGEDLRTFFLFSDLLLHVSGGEAAGWSAVGLGIANVMLGADECGGGRAVGAASDGVQYRLRHQFELEDVTVVGSDEVTESGLRYGFEILSTDKSFAVFADSLDAKNDWLNVIRDAKAALMSDRRTLQRTVTLDRASAPAPSLAVSSSTSRTAVSSSTSRTAKRISLPVPGSPSLAPRSAPSTAFLTVPPAPTRQISLPSQLSPIPPTPADEAEQSVFAFPSSPSAYEAEEPQSVRTSDGNASSFGAPISPPTDLQLFPVRPRTLSRSRRWSEMHPSHAVQALASALSLTSVTASTVPSADDIASPEIEYRVVEEYRAPVWTPDSKVSKCKACQAPFGMSRRRHHCRLCGGVFCYLCSSKYFIIPGNLLAPTAAEDQQQQPDRLARACDSCHRSVFEPATPASRFLASHPSDAFETFRQPPMSAPPHDNHRLSRILNPQTPNRPVFDFAISSPPFKPFDEPALPAIPAEFGLSREGGQENVAPPMHPQLRRTRKTSAVNELRKVLGR
ncbi:hypothetical protein JCM11251_007704 [Rhodosporidiobolus azoricus]